MIEIYSQQKDVADIDFSIEAKALLISIFYNYIATDNQKINLKSIIDQRENEAIEKMYNDIFDNKKSNIKNEVNNDNEKEKSLVVYNKNRIFSKIKKIIGNLFNIFKK